MGDQRLHDLVHEVKVPVEIVPDIKGRQRAGSRAKTVPRLCSGKNGYDRRFLGTLVRNTRAALQDVGPSSKPIPLTDEEVDKLGVDVRPDQT